jgi:hypothetical protein
MAFLYPYDEELEFVLFHPTKVARSWQRAKANNPTNGNSKSALLCKRSKIKGGVKKNNNNKVITLAVVNVS